MWLRFLILRLVASSLVLDGIRYPVNGQLQKGMLRDLGDLWRPSEPGSNIIPCGEWGPQGTRLNVLLGDTFLIQGSIPLPEGGGVLTVDAIFDPQPNFNMAGRLYKSTRFAVEDIPDQPTNFSLSVVLPSTAQPGPLSVQVKYDALVAKYAFFQCADLTGVDPNAPAPWSALGWWIGGLVVLAIGVIVTICAYCICCKRCCSKSVKAEPIDGTAAGAPMGYPDHTEVSLKDPRDREVSEGSLEIEDMNQSESEGISDDETPAKTKK